jgi:hypothetical protein
MAVRLDELTIADEPGAWRARGFAVEGDACAVGGLRLRLTGEGERGEAPTALVGWSLRGVEATDLDGLATTRSERAAPAAGPAHPNGVTGLDHVVAVSADLDRTVAALRGAGLDLRRLREEPTPAGAPRQAFFHLGEAILEVVQEPEEATARAGGDRPRLLLGPRLRRRRPRRHRRLLRRARQRPAPGHPAGPPHRHPAPLRRPRPPGCADVPARALGPQVLDLEAEVALQARR